MGRFKDQPLAPSIQNFELKNFLFFNLKFLNSTDQELVLELTILVHT